MKFVICPKYKCGKHHKLFVSDDGICPACGEKHKEYDHIPSIKLRQEG